MSKSSAQVTAADISRLAGVTRATVSNWRRRHQDFPSPSGGTDASPLYDLPSVISWLEARGQSFAASPAEELRSVLRLAPGGSATRLLPAVLAGARLGETQALSDTAALADADLAARAQKAVADLADTLPEAEAITYRAGDAHLLRALLRCVQAEGGQSALDVIAERELEDSAATGAYTTPAPLADLMARLVAPAAGDVYPSAVLDPACGNGSLLVAAARLGATRLLGQDILTVQAQRTAVRLRLTSSAGVPTIRSGDTLRADAFPGLTVDAALCQPPYGVRDWGHDELAYDPRWAYGVPPRAESELAWNQHVLSHLVPGGQAVVLLPPAPASRGSGRRVRTEMLRSGAIRAVIALPPGAATPLHIGLHLWVLQRPETGAAEQHRVLFIDASGGLRTPAAGSMSPRKDLGADALDWSALTALVLGHWRAFDADPTAFTDEPGVARAVPVIELLDDLTDITPARHVRVTPGTTDPSAVARRVDDSHVKLTESVATLADRVAAVGGPQTAGEQSRSWRTATIADLARGGAVTVHRAVLAGRDQEPSQEYTGRAVLLGGDVSAGTRATGSTDDRAALLHPVLIEEGDVFLRSIRGSAAITARVADAQDAGALLGPYIHLFRPDPGRLDPWFLACFLSAKDNISSATVGSTAVQIQAQRLRVPLLPLADQRRYGEAFRRLYELRTAARQVAELAAETTELLTTGLTSGALLPADGRTV
ncbi:N-6 DNA methylase [Actinacidiphila sp. bgisy145]|uniref:N-6 DNA methylase n=1 Tax=Actinacidiphila sp. bgisy145 TaxID=3413792 RepID=UPI003EBEBDAE